MCIMDKNMKYSVLQQYGYDILRSAFLHFLFIYILKNLAHHASAGSLMDSWVATASRKS